MLIKFDQYKVLNTEFKAFFEDMVFIIKKSDKLGHVAYVGNSELMKALIQVDNMFFKNKSKGREEKYFDISEIEKAYQFINKKNGSTIVLHFHNSRNST